MPAFINNAALFILAFIFSVGSRCYWVYWALKQKQFIFNNHLMINTNDGYAYASGVQALLANSLNPSSFYSHTALSELAFILVSLGFDLADIMLYLPMILGSFIVFPLIGIGILLDQKILGFIAALIASIAQSYYNRTMAGYFDTDMLVVVLPCFLLYILLFFIIKRAKYASLLAGFCVLLCMWWYPQSLALLCFMIFIFFIYTLVFNRKDKKSYLCFTLMLVALLPLAFYQVLALICLLFLMRKYLGLKALLGICLLVFAILLFKGSLNTILTQLDFYLFKASAKLKDSLVFYDVSSTIQEAASIDILEFVERISSAWWVFIPSFIGLYFLLRLHSGFILALPLLVLGFLSLKAGLRFSIYAVPVMALGFASFTSYIFAKFSKYQANILMISLCFSALLPSFSHIYFYKIPTVFTKEEASILKDFHAKPSSYFISWWDYGYPIRYFAGVNTLVDGGKHLGKENFFPSFVFLKDGKNSANMAKLAVNYSEKYPTNNDLFLKMLTTLGFKTPKDFLLALPFMDIRAKKDIYLYMPYRMLDILNVVYAFSNIDFKQAKEASSLFFTKADIIARKDGVLLLDNSIEIKNELSSMQIGKNLVNFHSFINITDLKNGIYKVFNLDSNSRFYLIYLEQSGSFLIMDERVYKSSFIQLFLFNNYDKKLFKLVSSKNVAKIYKVKN